MNLDGLVLSDSPPRLYLVEGPKVDPASLRELEKGAGKSEIVHDGPRLAILANIVNPQIHLTDLDKRSKNGDMVKEWLQRDFFRSLVDAKISQGISKEQQARESGIALSTFITHYSGNREPGKKTLKLMTAYYQVELSSLTDDPGNTVAGVPLDDWSKMSPAKRLVIRSIAQKIGPDEVTDEKAKKVWKALDSLIEDGSIKPPKT
jgi:hypothetical protein